jgi:hypothetical protein
MGGAVDADNAWVPAQREFVVRTETTPGLFYVPSYTRGRP